MVALFRKTWATSPREHSTLLSYVKRDDVWQMPEMYDYARDVIIPKDRAIAGNPPWLPFAPFPYVVVGPQSSRPPATKPAASLLIDLAFKQGKINDLAGEIETTRKKLPNWTAGDVLLAMALCRAGRHAEAESLVRTLPDTIKKDSVASSGANLLYAYYALGVELEQSNSSRDLAARVYENALNTPYSYLQFRFDPERAPLRRLVNIYRRDRRFEAARARY